VGGTALSEAGGDGVTLHNQGDGDLAYFEYLRGRSFRGWLYRRFWLYPRLRALLRGRVLDIGCGLGDFLEFYKKASGVDINPHTVAWCRQRGLDAQLMQPDRLPFPEATFDAVVLDNVLEHLVDPMPLLQEMRRVLRPGGLALMGVPGERGYAADPDHKVFYDADTLRRVAQIAAFTPVRLLYMPFHSDWLARHLPQYCLYALFRRA
jgi:SAM-dependent methyltransferase